ncbi:uncharacterized protein FIBRA_02711 [Fibroporia radiculosa]|uniref:Zn-dependent exopeptidase n=1 Tax=Fibroporia radiculosa TaxID=599839 RepID=J4HVD1_9APHY|nr:uncharacterized protein FIBRA_02711 [Fibroporia radiculosa]CCM00672.1 predicted protein [Fibroporia radiculosa]
MKARDIEKDVLLADDGRPDDYLPQPQAAPRSWSRGLLKFAKWYFVVVSLYVVAKRLVSCEVDRDGVGWVFDAFTTRGGYRTEERLTAKEIEKLYLSIPTAESALAASRAYATHPHLAGSTEDFEDARVILQLFQEHFGIAPPDPEPIFPAGTAASRNATLSINKLQSPAAWIDVYYPVMNTPLDRSLDILEADGASVWSADLIEDGDPADPEAGKYKDTIPTFHGLSRDGEAEGELIYVNYGLKEDYDAVVAAGGNFTGKIVLARYGGNFRGLKIQLAQEHGAVAALIYSDLRDDGSVTVENGYAAYPAGPARNPTSVQRGSVQFISAYPGDPTTPGYPAYEDAVRTAGENIPKIPSLPISWLNAERLLAEIDSTEHARELTGKSSERKIKLVNHVHNKVTPIWNTMAAIPGHIKNETVILGCHRDAWVMGAADPTSGTVSLHELVRGLGALLKRGWKPLRNIVIASWDAEEYGLIGSTEMAEDFPEWITQNVVAYLNIDVSVSGSQWGASGSPSLAHLIRQTALDVPHPTAPGKSLWDATKDVGPFAGPSDTDFLRTYNAEQQTRALVTGIPPLGSGSDYTPFLQHLGIASMDQGFGNTPSDAVYHYHSVYDSERWQELYGDPGFHRHVAAARHMGLTALRIIDAIIIPLNTTQYALELDTYLDEVENVASSLSLAVSPDFSGLRSSITNLQAASIALDGEKVEAEEKLKELLQKLPMPPKSPNHRHLPKWLRKVVHAIHHHLKLARPIDKLHRAAVRVQTANAKLRAFERGFISGKGLTEREWYKHLGVAPGKYLGYGATTLPSVTEALTLENNSTLAEIEAKRVSILLDKLAKDIAV